MNRSFNRFNHDLDLKEKRVKHLRDNSTKIGKILYLKEGIKYIPENEVIYKKTMLCSMLNDREGDVLEYIIKCKEW